eukprot:366354-Chlamydomonas_euryale.AAC.6
MPMCVHKQCDDMLKLQRRRSTSANACKPPSCAVQVSGAAGGAAAPRWVARFADSAVSTPLGWKKLGC